jgi:hypothetical protein
MKTISQKSTEAGKKCSNKKCNGYHPAALPCISRQHIDSLLRSPDAERILKSARMEMSRK